ncbi:MAG: branched-chain amino acid ABC transporter permease, partial [Euryarchaeota archaeon]|nr:branched-chain amino acid ABC transporter permease [Euryarchaeota archaeon]
FSIYPTKGLLPGINAFYAAVVGVIGNIYGAFLGGFLIGLAENVGGAFIATVFRDAIAFFLLVFFLVFRPTGILGAKGSEVRRK